MSLYSFAKEKARSFITSVISQSNPEVNTGPGSAVRNLYITPYSLINSAAVQEIDSLSNLNLGNYSNISPQDMDILASNLLVTRPTGSPSVVTVRVYVDSPEAFVLDSYPYFRTQAGVYFRPPTRKSILVSDFREEDGDIYISIPCISTTYGSSAYVDEGEVSIARDFPISFRYVTNPSSSTVSSGAPTNAEFFEQIKNAISTRSLNDIGGIKKYVTDNYPNVSETKIVPAGHALMKRDEVWTSDGTTPNLDREGLPFASHTSLGTVNFDVSYGQAYSASGVFTSDMIGKRVSVSGDEELFRLILDVIDANNAVFSGHPLEGSASASLLGEGPRIRNMADVYMYMPNIEAQSIIVDRRFRLTSDRDQSGTKTKVYFDVASGYSYASLPTTGKLVVSEGTEAEVVLRVTGNGEDANGTYLSIASTSIDILDGDDMSLYPSTNIEVGVDIEESPVLYVLSCEKLDPLTLESIEVIQETRPGVYASPGWYMSSPDPGEIFSARERKFIVLDNKEGNPGYAAVSISSAYVSSSSSVKTGLSTSTSATDKVSKGGFDFSGMEGRQLTLTNPEFNLDTGTASGSIIDGAGAATITITGVNSKWASNIGYRDDVLVTIYDSGSGVLETLTPGEIMVYGNKVRKKSGSNFSASADSALITYPSILTELPATGTPNQIVSIDGTLFMWTTEWASISTDSKATISALSTSGIVSDAPILGTVELVLSTPLVGVCVVDDPTSVSVTTQILAYFNVSISADSLEGDYDRHPIRVTYATHSDIASLQAVLDSSENQLLCKDTLARSFMPSVIDATIRYTGPASSQDFYNRFMSLLQRSVSETNNGETIRLDISNIIAALDDDGLADSIDPNFEVKVMSFLSDGEFEVRYLNPSELTKQNMAVYSASTAGDKRITVKRLRTTASIPSRGLIKLGGNNPDTQESIPYEAVIDIGGGQYDLILRSATSYNHPAWETATVSVRDYNPSMEYGNNAIFIPSSNRPYIRNLVVIKGG